MVPRDLGVRVGGIAGFWLKDAVTVSPSRCTYHITFDTTGLKGVGLKTRFLPQYIGEMHPVTERSRSVRRNRVFLRKPYTILTAGLCALGFVSQANIQFVR